VSRTSRLVIWLGLVAALIALAYYARFAYGAPTDDPLYKVDTAVQGAFSYAIMLAIVLAIAGGARDLLALRRPPAWGRALSLAAATFIGIFVVTGILDHFLHAGKEQGLTPSGWDSSRAGAYAANFVVVALVAPVVEELTYRGLGFTLLERYGQWVAIVVTAVLFGASHGLVEGLPVLTAFGIGIGWLRSRTGSVYPGMLVHAVFNGLALVLAVTT
jgi:membrane protease YdiL (CAAX protease family)